MSTYISLSQALSWHCATAQVHLDRSALASLTAAWRQCHARYVFGLVDDDDDDNDPCHSSKHESHQPCSLPCATLSPMPLPLPRHVADELLHRMLPQLLAASQQRLADRAARHCQRWEEPFPDKELLTPSVCGGGGGGGSSASVQLVQQRIETLALV